MADITFGELIEAAQKLTPQQKSILMHSLQSELWDETTSSPLTREQALEEFSALRAAGAFEQVESLRGKYGRPDLDLDDAHLNAYLREIGTAWEQQLDDTAPTD